MTSAPILQFAVTAFHFLLDKLFEDWLDGFIEPGFFALEQHSYPEAQVSQKIPEHIDPPGSQDHRFMADRAFDLIQIH